MTQSYRVFATALAVLLLGGGAFVAGYYLQHATAGAAGDQIDAPPAAPPVAKVNDLRPDLQLHDLTGTLRSISEWDGRLLVVNFWATWCPPCVHEIPEFMSLQADYTDRGVQFLGVAVDEVGAVQAFADQINLNYPTLHGQLEAMASMRAYGNRYGGLPYTVVVNPTGTIVHQHAGPLAKSDAKALIDVHLKP